MKCVVNKCQNVAIHGKCQPRRQVYVRVNKSPRDSFANHDVQLSRHPICMHYISSRKICRGKRHQHELPPASGLRERAATQRAGTNKSLSNCSLKNPTAVVSSKRWRPTKASSAKTRSRRALFRSVGRSVDEPG